MLDDSVHAPMNSVYHAVVPVWKGAEYIQLFRYFEIKQTFPAGTILFSAAKDKLYSPESLTPAPSEGPDRFFVQGTRWPVVCS